MYRASVTLSSVEFMTVFVTWGFIRRALIFSLVIDVLVVEDEMIAEGEVLPGDANAGHRMPKLAHHLGCRAAEGRPADDGTHHHSWAIEAAHPLSNVRHGQDGVDAQKGVGGTEDQGAGVVQGLVEGGRGLGIGGASESYRRRLWLASTPDEVVLEGQNSLRCFNFCADLVVTS